MSIVKKVLFVVFLAVVFSAIALSASQLAKRPTAALACGSPCNKTVDTCAKPCYCFITVEGSVNGVCQPEGNIPGAASPIHTDR